MECFSLKELKKYFGIAELVSPTIFNRFGEKAWHFFDLRLLETLYILRTKVLKVPLVCNNWKSGGSLTQRGFRENISAIMKQKTLANVLYVSLHSVGKAIDLSSPSLSADEMRAKILENAKLFPYPIRIEDASKAPTWLHLDLFNDTDKKVVVFK